MAKEVVKNGAVYIDGYDLTTDHTDITLALVQNAIEANCMQADDAGTAKFMQTWLAGQKSFSLAHSGYSEAGTGKIGTVVADRWGTAGTIFTVCGAGSAIGNVAYSGYCTGYQHQEIEGQVGGMAGYAAAGFSQGTPCFRGTILGTGLKSTTGNGTAYNLGAITAGTNALYAALHVTAITGSDFDLTVDIYSDSDANFSSPTKRASFSAITAITSEIISLATAVTDAYWRATWTISSEDTITIALNVGIINV